MNRDLRKRAYKELKNRLNRKIFNKVFNKIPSKTKALWIEYVSDSIQIHWATELNDHCFSGETVPCLTKDSSLSYQFKTDMEGSVCICTGQRIIEYRKLRMDVQNNPFLIEEISANSFYYGYGSFEDCVWDLITGFRVII